uniref:Uncharacterized protein n=1 Tax=Brassica oleracea TaxID=3712 RepID=A0A3P6ESQ9_BRAOL|nr:unnamed protein product [Brassica oleracea]
MFLWAEFRDPRFYPSSCESLPSIAMIGGLTEAARLGTSQAELKDITTRAPINPDYFETSAVIFNRYQQDIYEATNCSLLAGKKWLCMVQL